MADNNTFVLFEEIKNKLETIYRELKELKEKENIPVSLPVQSTPAQSDEQKEQKEHPQPQELLHRHSFDIKSSKVFTSVVAVSILCFASLVGNYFLWQSKQQYKDDALKFRIIRVWRGCSPKEILWLNDVFDIHRNEKTIKFIKEKAGGYDLQLKSKADSLMQDKIK